MSVHTPFLDALTPSAIRNITAQIRNKKRDGIAVVNFAGGMPDPAFFPAREFAEITADVLREEGGAALQYAASDGYDPLRQAIAELMKQFQVQTGYENILITCGSQQALSYLSRALLQPGDVVLCEKPSYVGALDTFRAQRAQIVGIDMDADGMIPDALEAELKKQRVKFIYAIPDFQNPTGRCMSVERRKRLVALAEKYDTYIVEDAPYSMICFNGTLLPAIKSFDTANRVFYLGSFSKTICPGIRVGWLVADGPTLTQLIYLKQRDDLQVGNLSQRQTYRYITKCDFAGHLGKMRALYHERCDCMARAVREAFPADTKLILPQGGLFMWLELPEGLDALTLFDAVFARNVAFVPGCYFYPDGSGANTLRLNFCTNDCAGITPNVKLMGDVIRAFSK